MVSGEELRELARHLRECPWEPATPYVAAAVLDRLADEQEAAQASFLRVRSHAAWLVGFLSTEGPMSEPSRERAHRKAQELLAEITAAQAASSEPESDRVDEDGESPRTLDDSFRHSGSLDAEADAATVRTFVFRASRVDRRTDLSCCYCGSSAASGHTPMCGAGEALAALERLLAGKAGQ